MYRFLSEYSAMKVVVLRIDNYTVNIDVVENGDSYFSSKTKYQVKKKGKNTYVLSLEGISDAFITIDNAGHLTYIHPKVNIDGEIYTLNITANKKLSQPYGQSPKTQHEYKGKLSDMARIPNAPYPIPRNGASMCKPPTSDGITHLHLRKFLTEGI